MMLTDAFKGHGTFFYLAQETIRRHENNPETVAKRMKDAGMTHGWVRLHSWSRSGGHPTVSPYQPTRRLITALRQQDINVAGWGWNQGADPGADADTAAQQLRRYELQHYVADIEHQHSGANWTKQKIRTYFSRLRGHLDPAAQILVSTFGFVGTHAPQLMQEAEPYVDGFSPQVYWFYYPKPYMTRRHELPNGARYKLASPADYTRLCIDMWEHYISKPIIVTGQAYWGEAAGFNKTVSEKKLRAFMADFQSWDRVHGFNWWHFGHPGNTSIRGAMSPAMFTDIATAKLGNKPFKTCPKT